MGWRKEEKKEEMKEEDEDKEDGRGVERTFDH